MRKCFEISSDQRSPPILARNARPFSEEEIEVRQLYELDDLGPSDAIERFRELEARKK